MAEPGRCNVRTRGGRTGATLLELLVVVIIIGVIAGVAIARTTAKSLDTKRNTCYVNMRNIEVQAQLWYREQGAWPSADLSDLVGNRTFFPDGRPVCPVDGSAYLLDSTSHRVVGHTH